MDVAAHALWVGAALVVAVRRTQARVQVRDRRPANELAGAADLGPGWKVVCCTVVASALPDLVHMLPVAGWAIPAGAWGELIGYGLASPGQEPVMPLWVGLASHHLHCIFHSALVAGLVHLSLIFLWRRRVKFLSGLDADAGLPWYLAWPLLAWWSHILIDVLTHSDDYYPSPVLYPLTYVGFDGVAWNRPAFMFMNYLALGLVWLWLFRPGRND